MKQTLLLMMLAFGMININVSAQTKKRASVKETTTTKTRRVENNGYVWYSLHKGNLWGAQDIEGNIIVPIQYSDAEEDWGYENVHYFRVKKGDFVGAYTPNGFCVIPIEQHYTDVKLYYEFGKVYWVVKKNGGATGVLDAKGQVVIIPNELYTGFRIGHDNDGTYYFSARRGSIGSGFEGLYDLNGKEIIPADKYTFVFYNGGKPYAILGYGNNEKRIDLSGLSISQYTKYDYTLYGGLFSDNRSNFGNSSSSSSSSSNSSSSSSSNSNSNNSGGSTTTIVVEHQHTPQPVQEWQACFGCGGMGTMGCDNCGGSGTKYIGDRLHRCSRCNGQGIIPCNICYGSKGKYITVYR